MSNKLYTEQEIRRFFNEIYFLSESTEECIDELTPIELPTDKEILTELEIRYKLKSDILRLAFCGGAKWMRDKIQGG